MLVDKAFCGKTSEVCVGLKDYILVPNIFII